MKKFILFIFAIWTINLYSQDNNSILTVSGQAKLMVTPDITVINIELSSTNLDYSISINDLQKKSADLKSFLKGKGITSKYIKSENFQVDKQYGYENGVRRYLGYISNLWIRLEFLNDNDLANKIINAIGSANTDADISITFEISITKQDSINNKLIEFAIQDAKTKAELIAKSTNQRIIKIDKINYGVRDNVTFDREALSFSMSGAAPMQDKQNKSFTITPKDIEKSTQIIIYWQLKNN